MKLRKVRFPFDSRTEWHILGRTNDGTSTQDDDGFRNMREELKVETVEEAVKLFEARVEELKQETRPNGQHTYESIALSLKMKKGGGVVKTVKEVSLLFEKQVREEVITLRAGRGWIESKRWLRLEGKTKLKNGDKRTKYVDSIH